MKLYYSAGSCSTCCHIALEESGLKYEAIEIDWDKAEDPNLALTQRLNPLGTLPVMILDGGKVLSQNIAILTHIADQAPQRNLLPSAGTFERIQAMNWLSFVAADLHKGIGLNFGIPYISSDEKIRGAVREWAVTNSNRYLKYLEENLAGKDYLMGRNFTVADAYCFVVVNWTKYLDISLQPYPNLRAYMARVLERPAVHKVMKSEGLLDD